MLESELFNISVARELCAQGRTEEHALPRAAPAIYGVVYPSEFNGIGEFDTWAVRGFTAETSRVEQLGETDIFGTHWEPIDMYRMTPKELKRMGEFTVGAVAGHLEGHELPKSFFAERAARVCKGLGRANPAFLERVTL